MGDNMLEIKLIGHDYEKRVNDIIDFFIEDREKCRYKIESSMEIGDCITVTSMVYDNEILLSKCVITKDLSNSLSPSDEIKIRKRQIQVSLFITL